MRILAGMCRYLLLLFMVMVAVASFIPLLETSRWWVRYLDFPRVQLILALFLLIALYLVCGGFRRKRRLAAVALALFALGYNVERVYPYSRMVAPMAETTASCSVDTELRIMVANVRRGNRQAKAFFRIVAEAHPDILLTLETDSWWNAKLDSLRDTFPFQLQKVPPGASFYGINLLSRFPLLNPRIESTFGAKTPTIVTGVQLPDGQGTVQFIGLHPRPPQSWSQPTTLRDATLIRAATMAAASPEATVVAGDFNAVPWERVVRRMMRIGGLLDPRVGRGYFASYDAESGFRSWPLDQILFENRIGMMEFRRLPAFGSDHYPVLADLCLKPDMAGRQSAPRPQTGDRKAAEQAVQAARRIKR